MATIVDLAIDIDTLPPDWSIPSGSRPSQPIERTLVPAGPSYYSHVQRSLNQWTFDDQDKHRNDKIREQLQQRAAQNETDTNDLGVGDEPESADLLASDPKEWKKLDLYAVLGLSHLRYRATQDQIKIAHRKKVLKHHPDKKAGLAGDSNDDAFFKCIAKATEMLSNTEKRRQFDSIDPYYQRLEDNTPDASDIKGAKDPEAAFFKLLTPVFDREARFSKSTEPPLALGSPSASKEQVEAFYDFWYNFDSWRSFEWLDKEINEGSDSRDDKRYTEKKNKTDRAKRKKDDITRVRSLVDMTLALDPRIKRIKQEEKDARAKKKGGKSGTATPVKSVKELEEEAKRRKEEDAAKDEAEKAAKADAKKAKAAAANAAKKARREQRAKEEEGVAS